MARQTIDVGVPGDPASGEALRNALIKINDMTSEIYPPLTDTRTPTDASVTNAKVAATAAIAESKLALAADASAGTPSRRTLGTGALQGTAGNDSRLSNARTPTAHNHSGAEITSGTVPVAQIGTGTKDATTFYNGLGAFAVPSGGGGGSDASATAKGIAKLSVAPAVATDPIAAGTNDTRLSDARTPTTHTHPLDYPPFVMSGLIGLKTGTVRLPVMESRTITQVRAMLGAASTSGSVTATLARNGTVVATVSIAASSNAANVTGLSIAVVVGDYLTMNVTAAGTNASDLTVLPRAG